MHGDIALCEAQNSVRALFHLVELGVPFPHDSYGSFVGYKTDHDPRQRATSAGPLTSHLMFESLARDVEKKKIRVIDRHQVIGLLTGGEGSRKKVIGAAALDAKGLASPGRGLVLFNATNIILGTGGPAGMYRHSVYPESQTGSHGLAFEIGAVANNLTESQYGLASLKFRWNLSGTYQQVIPRYFSVDPAGGNERDFLADHFPDMGRLATAVFLKGYQWPFDPRKAGDFGSSLIDILVYQEMIEKGRRVFLDYSRNPSGGGKLEDFSLDLISKEAYTYLEKSGALLPTPIERLRRMNRPAIEIYKSHGIDLDREPLEIAVCAQHNNGGFKGNIWWESNVRHLFPVGEVNGTHGVCRPGGSALNSGQVGSMRAALFIARRYRGEPLPPVVFLKAARGQIREKLRLAAKLSAGTGRGRCSAGLALAEIRERMSRCGAFIRRPDAVGPEIRKARKLYARLRRSLYVPSANELPQAFRCLDLCLTHIVYLEAISEYLRKGGKSRGSYLVLDPRGIKPAPGLDDSWKFSLNPPESDLNRRILEVCTDRALRIRKKWVDVRPIPRSEGWFENVWSAFLNDEIISEEAWR
jgi:succinate dehydrogenase/fumarate reductase flavoprotein subunit